MSLIKEQPVIYFLKGASADKLTGSSLGKKRGFRRSAAHRYPSVRKSFARLKMFHCRERHGTSRNNLQWRRRRGGGYTTMGLYFKRPPSGQLATVSLPPLPRPSFLLMVAQVKQRKFPHNPSQYRFLSSAACTSPSAIITAIATAAMASPPPPSCHQCGS